MVWCDIFKSDRQHDLEAAGFSPLDLSRDLGRNGSGPVELLNKTFPREIGEMYLPLVEEHFLAVRLVKKSENDYWRTVSGGSGQPCAS